MSFPSRTEGEQEEKERRGIWLHQIDRSIIVGIINDHQETRKQTSKHNKRHCSKGKEMQFDEL